ncbi:MAG: efflux RND transporter periplasmic adaptor subunit [Verrucomicrobiales bacterium]
MQRYFLHLSASAFALMLASCGGDSSTAESSSDKPSATPVTATTVETDTFADTTVAVGTLRSSESVDVSASVTERLESIHFEDGQAVAEGDILAQLATKEEEAMMETAQAELEEEEREIERLERLARQNAVAQVTLEERRTRGVTARANIDRIEAMLADRRIVAPFDGVVGLRRISPGALVEPGTVITTLDQIDTMKLDFTVPEVFLGSLEKGTELEAETPAFPGEPFIARIDTVDTRVDPLTRSVSVRALLPNDNRKLRPGMLMTVDLKRNERQSPAIPERAVVPLGQRKSVYVIQADSTVRLVAFETGSRIPGFVEAVSDVAAGDHIVTDGILSLSDGAEVEVEGEFEGPTPRFDPTDRPLN